MSEVALVVGEERVEDAAVDDRAGRVERALRIRCLEGERVVDDERRPGGAMRARGERGGRAGERRQCDERHDQPPSLERGTTHLTPSLDSRGAFQTIRLPPRPPVGEAASAATRAPASSRPTSAAATAPGAAGRRRGSGRTRRGSGGGTGSPTVDAQGRGPPPAGSPAGSRRRPRGAPPRSAPPCRGAPETPREESSAQSRPSARGT